METLHLQRLILLLLIFLTLKATGQQVGYHYAYGTANVEQADRFKLTKDGGCITFGAKTVGSSLYMGFALKTDSLGNIIWTKDYKFPESILFSDCIETFDGGYMVVGSTLDSVGIPSINLLKTDGNGNSIWSKKYGNNTHGIGFSVIQTIDSGFIVLGDTTNYFSGTNPPKETYVFKTDQNGIVLWSHTIGGTNWDECRTLWQAKDGGFFLLGSTESFGDTLRDIWLTKIGKNGQFLWSKTYGKRGYDFGVSGINTLDGNLLITGLSLNDDSIAWNINMIKMNNNGDTLWTRTFKKPGTIGFSPVAYTQEVDSGNFVYAGSLQTTFGVYEGYLMKVNASGNFQWAYRYTDLDNFTHVQKSIDGGLILFSVDTRGIGAGANDIMYVKTGTNGQSGCFQTPDNLEQTNSSVKISDVYPLIGSGCFASNVSVLQQNDLVKKTILCYYSPTELTNVESVDGISVYPTPSTGKFQIVAMPGNKKIVLYTILGEVVRNLTTDDTIIRMEIAKTGTYYLQVSHNTTIITKKIEIVSD